MKSLSYALLVTLIVSCNASKKKSSSTGAVNASAPYTWTTAFPKTLRISEQFSPSEATAIELMADAWSDAVDNKETFFEFGSETTEKTNSGGNLDRLRDSEMGVYKSNNWPDSLPGSALAVTQIFGRRFNVGKSDEFVNIEHADIILNADFYSFDTADTGSGFDFRTVMLHEMGHFLGLQHKEIARNSTVMYPSIDPNEAKRVPKAVDIEDLSEKYDIDSAGSTSMSASRAIPRRPKLQVQSSDPGTTVKIILELHADGNCVHKMDGMEFDRHPASLKSN